MDKFVADQYGDQIPAQDKKKKADITVTSGLAGADLVVTFKAP